MCIFIYQLYQTQKQKLMMNRELEFQIQSHGHHQDCCYKNPTKLIHKNILKIPMYIIKESVLSLSDPLFNLITLYFLLNVDE